MRSFIKSNILFLTLIYLVSCADPSLESEWRNKDIMVDGDKTEWQGHLKYFKDEKVAIGISNDNEFVYFCLATSDEKKIMKIMKNGFTVWLDPQSSDGETIGVQYPIKRDGNEIEPKGQRESMKGSDKSNNSGHLEKMITRFMVEQNEVLIVNKNKNPVNSYPIASQTGLEVKIDYKMHQLVYELKVPLANNNQATIFTDVLPNELVNVGFESGEIERAGNKEQGSMGQGDGGSSGGMKGGGRSGGGKGGQRGGGNSGGMKDTQTNIEFWMEVKLANSK